MWRAPGTHAHAHSLARTPRGFPFCFFFSFSSFLCLSCLPSPYSRHHLTPPPCSLSPAQAGRASSAPELFHQAVSEAARNAERDLKRKKRTEEMFKCEKSLSSKLEILQRVRDSGARNALHLRRNSTNHPFCPPSPHAALHHTTAGEWRHGPRHAQLCLCRHEQDSRPFAVRG